MAVEQHTLDNGTTVLIDPIKDSQTVGIAYTMHVGARFETKKENGISHFLEHMAFKGTTTRDAYTLINEIESQGGLVNAGTDKGLTTYLCLGRAAKFDSLHDVISDVVINPTLPEEELEVKRGVILGEIGQALDDPNCIVFKNLMEIAYPGNAYGRSILGPKKNIKKFSRADFMKFIDKHYHTGNLSVSVAGNVDVQNVLKRIEEATACLKQGKPSKFKKATFSSGEVHQYKELDQLHIIMAFNAASLKEPAKSSADIVMANILGNGMSSRLCQEVRAKRGLGYTICAGAVVEKDTGLTYIQAIVDPNRADQLIEGITEQLKRIRQDGVTQAELDKYNEQLATTQAFGDEGTKNRLEALRWSYDTYGLIKPVKDSPAEFKDVTPEDIKDAANRIFGSEPAVSSVGPKGNNMPSYDKIVKSLTI